MAEELDNTIDTSKVILWQYDRAYKFLCLLRGKEDLANKACGTAWDIFRREIFDIDTATAFGLWFWGTLIGIERPQGIPKINLLDDDGNWNFMEDAFDPAVWGYDGPEPSGRECRRYDVSPVHSTDLITQHIHLQKHHDWQEELLLERKFPISGKGSMYVSAWLNNNYYQKPDESDIYRTYEGFPLFVGLTYPKFVDTTIQQKDDYGSTTRAAKVIMLTTVKRTVDAGFHGFYDPKNTGGYHDLNHPLDPNTGLPVYRECDLILNSKAVGCGAYVDIDPLLMKSTPGGYDWDEDYTEAATHYYDSWYYVVECDENDQNCAYKHVSSDGVTSYFRRVTADDLVCTWKMFQKGLPGEDKEHSEVDCVDIDLYAVKAEYGTRQTLTYMGELFTDPVDVSDDTYRRILKARYFILFSNGSMPDLNKYCHILYNAGKREVDEDGNPVPWDTSDESKNIHIIENGDMTIEYQFNWDLDDEEGVIEDVPEVHPHPTGVESRDVPVEEFGYVSTVPADLGEEEKSRWYEGLINDDGVVPMNWGNFKPTDEQSLDGFTVIRIRTTGAMRFRMRIKSLQDQTVTINWGDGSKRVYFASSDEFVEIYHDYARATSYRIAIDKGCAGFRIGATDDDEESKATLTSIEQFADTLEDLSYAFYNCVNLGGSIIPWNGVMKDVSYAYAGCTSLTGVFSSDEFELMPIWIGKVTGCVEGASNAVRSLFYPAWGGDVAGKDATKVTIRVPNGGLTFSLSASWCTDGFAAVDWGDGSIDVIAEVDRDGVMRVITHEYKSRLEPYDCMILAATACTGFRIGEQA